MLNMGVRISFRIIVLGVELLDHMVVLFLIFRSIIAGSNGSPIFNFWGSSILFVIVAGCTVYSSTVLPTLLKGSPFSTSSLLFAIPCLLMIWGNILLWYFLVEQTFRKFCQITKSTVAEGKVMRVISVPVLLFFSYITSIVQIDCPQFMLHKWSSLFTITLEIPFDSHLCWIFYFLYFMI